MEVDAAASAAAPEKKVEEIPHAAMDLMQDVFLLSCSDEVVADKPAVVERVMAQIKTKNMTPLYKHLVEKLGWTADEALQSAMSKANTDALAAADAAVVDARDKFGDVEVADRQREKAEYLASIGDRAGAIKAYGDINQKTLSTGQKIDQTMAKARMAMQWGEWAEAKELIAVAKDLNEKGGDWDRRNRLKVYEGLVALATRDFPTSSALLLDSIATFTATEVCSYTDFVFYTVLAGLKSLDRVTLKKRVVDSPDILSSIADLPLTGELLNSFYETRYRDFLSALVSLYPALQRDRYVSAHAAYYLREMRLAAYVQFLESYKSVTLTGMARTFGLSVPFVDKELSRFIAAGRISAKIDAMSGIVETTRPDAKNAQYASVLKQGDVLLNKLQRLSRVVAL